MIKPSIVKVDGSDVTEQIIDMPQGDPGRPDAIEEITNRLIIHRISSQLVVIFAAIGVHPNWVSLLGFLSGWGAAYCYLQTPTMPEMVWSGFFAMIAWHIFDGTDGKLARFTGKTSAIGKVIDGIADYAVFAVTYIALMLLMWDSWGWGGVALAVAGSACHAMQAARYEAEREFYNTLILGKDLSDSNDTKAEGGIGGLLSRLQDTYEKAQSASKATLLTRKLHGLPAKRQLEIKHAAAPMIEKNIHLWSVMCANYRTIFIFVGVYIGMPELYFLLVLTLLNLFLILLSSRTTKLYAKLEAMME